MFCHLFLRLVAYHNWIGSVNVISWQGAHHGFSSILRCSYCQLRSDSVVAGRGKNLSSRKHRVGIN